MMKVDLEGYYKALTLDAQLQFSLELLAISAKRQQEDFSELQDVEVDLDAGIRSIQGALAGVQNAPDELEGDSPDEHAAMESRPGRFI